MDQGERSGSRKSVRQRRLACGWPDSTRPLSEVNVHREGRSAWREAPGAHSLLRRCRVRKAMGSADDALLQLANYCLSHCPPGSSGHHRKVQTLLESLSPVSWRAPNLMLVASKLGFRCPRLRLSVRDCLRLHRGLGSYEKLLGAEGSG